MLSDILVIVYKWKDVSSEEDYPDEDVKRKLVLQSESKSDDHPSAIVIEYTKRYADEYNDDKKRFYAEIETPDQDSSDPAEYFDDFDEAILWCERELKLTNISKQ